MACSFLIWIFLLVPHLQMCCYQAYRIKKVISQGIFLSNKGVSGSRLPAQKNQYNLNSYLVKKCYKDCECGQAPDMPLWEFRSISLEAKFLRHPLSSPTPPPPNYSHFWWAVASKTSRLPFGLPGNVDFPIRPSRRIIPKTDFNEFWYHSFPFIS